MNSFYCLSIGAFMIAAVYRNKDEMSLFLIWLILAILSATVGNGKGIM